MKRTLILLLAAFSMQAFPASVIRTAKESIKKKTNLEQTAKNLLAEAAKPETKHADRVECYVLAAECWKRVNEQENMKLYLKQKYDTAKFFSSIRQMFLLLEKADSLEAQPDERGRIRLLNRRRSHDLLLPYRKNLLAGGNWYFRKAQMKEALPYFETYIDAAQTSLFATDSLLQADTLMASTAYLAVHAAQKSQQPDAVLKYASLAKEANLRNALIQEFVTKAWLAKADTAQYYATMWDGLRAYPENTYFYSHVVDRLMEERQFDRALEVTDSMLTLQDSVPLFHYARSLLLLKLHRDREAIDAADACIQLDSLHADAYYNKGVASLNLAVEYTETACTDPTNPQCRRDLEIIRSLYELARQPMERVRQLQPERQERWAAPLYRIYLHLNMGREFDEMDRLLNGK